MRRLRASFDAVEEVMAEELADEDTAASFLAIAESVASCSNSRASDCPGRYFSAVPDVAEATTQDILHFIRTVSESR